MDLIVANGTIVTGSEKETIREGAVVIEDDRIVEVGKYDYLKHKYPRGYDKIDAKGKVVVPGLINTHHHAAMSLLRGYADDYPLHEWLEKWIWPLEKHMTGHDIYVGALLTAIESLLSGTTTVNTMYHYLPNENEAKAFAEAGLRGVIGHVCFSWRKKDDIKALEDLAKNWHGKENGRIRVSVCPHAPYTVDPNYMVELKQLSNQLNEQYGIEKPIIWHIHVAETKDEKEKIEKNFKISLKEGIFKYLDSLKVLDSKVLAVHCVWLSEKDIQIIRKRKVKVSHNPVSNLKLASGISPIPKLLESNVTVSLGTDSACSNNSPDMFEVMKVTALLHKGISLNPTVTPARQVFKMATIEGAKALNWEREIGSIEAEKKADLAIVNFRKPHLHPLYDEISHLVYSAKSADVETVLIDGRIVVENREVKTVNVEHVMQMAEKCKEKLLEKLQRAN